MTNKQRIKALKEFISTFNNNEHMFFCYMPCILSLSPEHRIEELRKFMLLQACEDCGGRYKMDTPGTSAFIAPSWNYMSNPKIYNEWKRKVAKRAIELLSE